MASQLPSRSRPHVARGPSRARPPRARLEPRAVPPSPERQPATRVPALLRFTRHGVAALAVVAGIVAMSFGTPTALIGGSGLVGAGFSIWLIAWLYRLGVEGDRAREAEELARRHFDRYGRWPDAS